MQDERQGSRDTPPVDLCAACGRPFVMPVALLDIVDEGLYLLALHCTNCDRLTVGVHEDAELEALERRNDRAVAEIEAALEQELVLPEDF